MHSQGGKSPEQFLTSAMKTNILTPNLRLVVGFEEGGSDGFYLI